MPWFRVDDNLPFHAKTVAAGNPAMGLWVRAGAWCAAQLTDGFFPDHMLATMGTKQQADRLVSVRLWTRAEGGYRFHEWGTRNPRKADVEAERLAASERMREHRARRKQGTQTTKPQVSETRSEDVRANKSVRSGEVRDLFGNPDPALPNPTQPLVTTSSAICIADAPRDDVERVCNHLADAIEANGATRPKVGKSWTTAARLMLDSDKRTEADVHAAIDWCQADEFWRANVLSMPKLREKYDQLRLQAQRKPGGGHSRNDEFRAMQERQMARALERERQMGIQ